MTTTTSTSNLPPTTTTPLDWALWYAQHGWPVFPLQPRDKRPFPGTNGFHDASTDELQIRDWWARWPGANIGVPIPDGLFVADVDVKVNGKVPENAHEVGCKRLTQLHPLLERTVMAQTGSGGWHVWFQVPEGVDISTGDATKFATLANIDKRLGGKHYVVVPPSLHACGGRYEWKTPPFGEVPILEMPDHIIRLAQAGKQTTTGGSTTSTGERRSQWDEDDAPITAGERNNALASRAGRMRRAGLAFDELFAALKTMNARRCQPSLPEREVRSIAESVCRYEPGRGRDHGPEAEPEPAEQAERTHTRRTPHSLADLLTRTLPQVQWAVPDLIPQGATLFAGKPKVGKSWAALALALAVGSGGRAFGQIGCERGHVLYLALEDTERRLQSRTLQLLGDDAAGWDGDVEFALEWEPLDRGRDGGPTGYARLDSYLTEHPDTRLVIVDTFAKIRPVEHAKGGYSYDDDYRAMGLLKRLADTHQTAFLIIHHTRKAQSDDPQDIVSGTTGLTGAVDSTMVLTRARGEQEAKLFMTGRDIEERELVLERQEATGLWVFSQATADEVSLPAKQRAVVAFLRTQPSGGPVAAQVIWQAVGGEKMAVYQLLQRMVNNGSLVKPDYGRFALSEKMTVENTHQSHQTSQTHQSHQTHQTGAGTAAAEPEAAKFDGLTGDGERPSNFGGAQTRMDSASARKFDGFDGFDGYAEPASPSQHEWLAKMGYDGDVDALTRQEASAILDGLFKARNTGKGKRAAGTRRPRPDDMEEDMPVWPAGGEPIPADDRNACVVCGADVLPGQPYCADHQHTSN